MAKSNNRVALKSVIVVREGKRVSPPIGKSFPFTAEEVEEIEKVAPTAIREARNEDDEASVAEVVALSNTNTRVVAKNVKPGAGKTSAMADGMDGTAVTDEGGSDSANGQTAATVLTVEEIESGVGDLSNDDLTAALNAERSGKKRAGAIKAYEAEVSKRAAAAAGDDDL